MVSDVKIDGVSSLLEKNNQRFNLRSQIISLNAGDKNIEIDFSSLNYAFPDKIKYAYKMDGVDDDWVYAVSYTHLTHVYISFFFTLHFKYITAL